MKIFAEYPARADMSVATAERMNLEHGACFEVSGDETKIRADYALRDAS